MIEVMPIIVAILGGIAYSLYGYINKVVDPTNESTWKDIDYYALVATAIVGAVVGIASVVYGTELSQTSVEAQLILYAGVVAILQKGLKTIYRKLKAKYPDVFE